MSHFFSTKSFHRQPRSGFTLVETLIAISIMTIAILGPMAISQSGLQAARYAQDSATAQFLAKEGVEYVKSRIYSNMSQQTPVAGDKWLEFGSGGATSCFKGSNQSCTVDARPGATSDIQTISGATDCGATSPPDSHCPFLYQDSNGFYGQNLPPGTPPTPYKRWFSVTPDGTNPDEASIHVEVAWVTSDQKWHSFDITDYVFYWYNHP